MLQKSTILDIEDFAEECYDIYKKQANLGDINRILKAFNADVTNAESAAAVFFVMFLALKRNNISVEEVLQEMKRVFHINGGEI